MRRIQLADDDRDADAPSRRRRRPEPVSDAVRPMLHPVFQGSEIKHWLAELYASGTLSARQ
eukprot:15056751-Alexandrium_andersonii.AAC.1